jgi:gliding motility-associated-like protein
MLFAENTNNSTFQYQESGSYIVNFVVNNDFPCQYSIEKIITVILDETIDQQTIPNVFTPNNDGTNDEIAFNELVNECIDFEVFILNRWGNLVYKAGRNDMPFTGKDLNGSELTDGIYFYKINSNDQTIHGHITIIK